MKWTRTTTKDGHMSSFQFTLGRADHTLSIEKGDDGKWKTKIDGNFIANCPNTLKTHRARRQFAVNLLRLRCQQYVTLKERLDESLSDLFK